MNGWNEEEEIYRYFLHIGIPLMKKQIEVQLDEYEQALVEYRKFVHEMEPKYGRLGSG